LLALAAPAQAHIATPMVLPLNGGGWNGGDPASMNAWREDFEAHGYRTRMIDSRWGASCARLAACLVAVDRVM